MTKLARASLSVSLMLAALSAASCSDDDIRPIGYDNSACRFNPAVCGGGPGASCSSNAHCVGGFCCQDSNCGGGMCTFSCEADVHCPAGMACEHSTCFFVCRSNVDCAPGQSCEHGRVCEW